ncbi:glucan endo-1,3-beta-glucosidase 14 [Rhododendron vialii]|uniref:glucan endo-1,3-beta-glucosidase 14 n=1 Tax=Rhododendron vialii TaxID=182163 RepID=UPI00265F2ED4|nr:glucan endo-1,3-beta-glucosidase 14 [Rhododendron vialii]
MAAKLSALLSALVLLLSPLSYSIVPTLSLGIGINYGQIADNLPLPAQVLTLLRSINVSRVKLYDADPNVLSAFANSNVEFVISISNGNLQNMTSAVNAQSWIQQSVQPYISQTKISCIVVGNEVLGGNDTQLMSYLLPAMQAVYTALGNLGLSSQVYVTSAHSLAILANSFPPSAGSFLPSIASYIQPILSFHSQANSPFLINAYPFFAYADNPGEVPLDYVLFEPNNGTVDPSTNLNYDNMLYAQIDAVYFAMKAMGHTDIPIKISETGWPSKGDPNQVGATVENAALYNGNLLQRIQEKQGTPANPTVPIDVYVFALFNENLKPGPTSERNYGLYYPNGSPVYNIGLQEGGNLPQLNYSASSINVFSYLSFLVLNIAVLLCA